MGFFDNSNIELINQCSSCTGILLCKHPHLPNHKGNKILLLFGAPTKYEELTGKSFEGNVYDWYKEQFDMIGIKYEECSKAHIVGCHSDSAKTLTKYKKKCFNQTIEFIKEVQPELIIAFGSDTLEFTVGLDFTRSIGSSEKWRGFVVPFRSYGFDTWLLTTFSFEEVALQDNLKSMIKKKAEKEKRAITTPKEIVEAVSFHSSFKIAYRLFLTDIRNAFIESACYPIDHKKLFPEDPAKTVPIHVLKDKNEIIKYLRKTYAYLVAYPKAIMTLDLETNGLKCFNKDKRVHSMAIYCDPKLGCFGFPLNMEYTTKKYDRYDPNIPKADEDIVRELKHIAELNPRVCGANYKFDMVWLKVVLGVELERCVWDTVVVAHLLDPRDGITSLKFQTFVRCGRAWEDTVHSYLESSAEDTKKYGTNALNDIFNAPYDDVSYYNCLDVVYTYFCMKSQLEEWKQYPNPNKWFAFKLFHKVLPVLAHMEENGILIDMKKILENMELCRNELKKIEDKIKDDPVWIKWGEIVGEEERSILSPAQIIDVFINHMHLRPHGISKEEKAKADLEWLSKLVDQEPFIQNILDYRKYTKILHTYLEGIAKEVNDDGRLRCFYTINNVSSYRIAANSPNFMNISSRDEFQVDLIKKCFIPDEGYYYTSFDFSGLENCGSAAICKDEYMKAVICEGRDMHKENALFMFCMSDEEFKALKEYDEEHGTHYAKANRNGGKAASFSVLYGAGKETVGGTLWKYLNEKQVRVTPTEFARDRVIKTLRLEDKYKLAKTDEDKEEFFLKQYCEHANDFLNDFWGNRMRATKDWKDNNMSNYFKTGMAFYPTGHIIHGLFSSLTINNAVIQGSSSCCTLYSLVLLDSFFRHFKLDARLINIIHDDINTLTKKEHIIKTMSLQKYIMEETTFKAFPWLTFKLSAECEISDITWGDKKGYDAFLDYYKENKEKIGNAVEKALDGDWIFENWR